MDNASATTRESIHVLSTAIVERIAAGEVIERPASVVRELIENALDARATAIHVDLREGGIRSIQVSDNGMGIVAEELPLAVAPHATSKVATTTDLDHIATLGFRGEALASIAAVAEMQICSACDDSGVGHALLLAPNRAPEGESKGRERGTTVTVRELFQQVPARLAMLRSAQYERTLALGIVRSYALAHPEVRFTVAIDGKLALQTYGGTTRDAIRAIYGMDVAHALLPLGPINAASGALDGWIASRLITFADRRHTIVCVNGRPVHHRLLLPAIEAGYRPLLHKGRHPLALALLTLEPSHVDPNIHPAKTEVLLRDEAALASLLREAVHTALGQPLAAAQTPMLYDGRFRHVKQFALPLRRRRASRIAEHFAQQGGATGAFATSTHLAQLSPVGQLKEALIIAQTPEGDLCLVDQHRAHERLLYEAMRAPSTRYTAATSGNPPSPWPGSDSRDVPTHQEGDLAAPGPQHQMLLEPLVIELSARQAQLLSSRLYELGELGFVCEHFGGSTFLVRALPSLPGAAFNLAAVAREVAADAAEDSDEWLEQFCIALACRAALRRGTVLDLSEQRALLGDLASARTPLVCPHGSPIIARTSHDVLARFFEW